MVTQKDHNSNYYALHTSVTVPFPLPPLQRVQELTGVPHL